MKARTALLALSLVGVMWLLMVLFNGYQRRVERMRSQRIITRIDKIWPQAGALHTDQSVAAVDRRLAPQVRELIRDGVSPNAWGKSDWAYNDQREFTPLMLAAMNRLPLTAQVLIDAGAELNTTDAEGRTALILAVEQGHSKVVKTLLAAGADANLMDRRGWTAMDYAEDSSSGFDRPEAVLAPLRKAGARRGPSAARRRQLLFGTFRLTRRGHGQFSANAWSHGIRFHSEMTLSFPENIPPVLTRERYHRLRIGMSYPEVARALGEEEFGGEMEPEFNGSFVLTQGRRRIALTFADARLSTKAYAGL